MVRYLLQVWIDEDTRASLAKLAKLFKVHGRPSKSKTVCMGIEMLKRCV